MRIFFFLFLLPLFSSGQQGFVLRGTVTERESGTPVMGADVRLLCSDGYQHWAKTDSGGHYIFSGNIIHCDLSYIVSAKGDSVMMRQFRYGLVGNPKAKFTTLYKDTGSFVIDLELLYVHGCGQVIEILFKKNSSEFALPVDSNDIPSDSAVVEIYRTMIQNPTIVVELGGHSTPDEKNKDALAGERMLRVKKMLLAMGIERERLVCKNYSDTHRLQNVDIPDKEKYNAACRRVTFSVLRKDYKPTK